MSWDVELAKELKKRNNKVPFEPISGDVIGINPLKISIHENRAIIDNSHCYICSKVDGLLVVGDKVLCLPAANGQKYFIIDKVV